MCQVPFLALGRQHCPSNQPVGDKGEALPSWSFQSAPGPVPESQATVLSYTEIAHRACPGPCSDPPGSSRQPWVVDWPAEPTLDCALFPAGRCISGCCRDSGQSSMGEWPHSSVLSATEYETPSGGKPHLHGVDDQGKKDARSRAHTSQGVTGTPERRFIGARAPGGSLAGWHCSWPQRRQQLLNEAELHLEV